MPSALVPCTVSNRSGKVATSHGADAPGNCARTSSHYGTHKAQVLCDGRTTAGMRCRETEVPDDMVLDFLADIYDRFNATTYNLLSNNCNNFSDEMAQFLVGEGIPVRSRYPDVAIYLKPRHPGSKLRAMLVLMWCCSRTFLNRISVSGQL